LNLESEGEGITALAGSDARGTPGADGVEEGLNLKAKRLAGCNGRFDEGEAGPGAGGLALGRGGCGELRERGGVDAAAFKRGGDLRRDAAIEADDEQFAARVVDGDVLTGLEEAQFAHALSGDAGGGEVGDTA